MSLKNKPLPKFEVSASYEKFAQGDIVMDAPDAGERDEGCCGECSQASAESVGAGANVEPFEASVDRVVTCVCSQNPLREVLYKTLAFCGAPRTFDEVEDFIAAQDEFIYSHIIQEPFTLAHMLLNAGGLSQTPLDDAGNAISEESLAAMSDDEACDAVATYRLETTPAGAKAVELLAPERRIASQIAKVPRFAARRANFPKSKISSRTPKASRWTWWPILTNSRPTTTSTNSTVPERWFGGALGL